MMKTNKFVASLSLACAFIATPAVYAADISNPPGAIELTEGAGFFGRLFTGNAAGDTFADHYTFSVGAGSAIVADLFSYSGSPTAGIDITGIDLYTAAGALVGTGTAIESDGIEQWQLTTSGLAADDYYVQVSGSLKSGTPAVYSASLAVTPVPEPATYAMMVGGLALVGALARRRRQ
ncbi:FxDxF family PEP-CTERM protein [Pseudoduganella armeniaca]|uniref:PEP-CTERM sorting domain-containing protein n=1 Tax=Pseudoduganella armeniaca TaxID=2072590 RepID=A0A2R4CFG4_9BURK|nr:FxDxF family PEP-CTERM protein [Pseudoduganella armeniaca]AVR98384.1 PEP-CTERM sorting domain-containing protein [Pseudoduganella armeniaca]